MRRVPPCVVVSLKPYNDGHIASIATTRTALVWRFPSLPKHLQTRRVYLGTAPSPPTLPRTNVDYLTTKGFEQRANGSSSPFLARAPVEER